jgi:hypothetical protein
LNEDNKINRGDESKSIGKNKKGGNFLILKQNGGIVSKYKNLYRSSKKNYIDICLILETISPFLL